MGWIRKNKFNNSRHTQTWQLQQLTTSLMRDSTTQTFFLERDCIFLVRHRVQNGLPRFG